MLKTYCSFSRVFFLSVSLLLSACGEPFKSSQTAPLDNDLTDFELFDSTGAPKIPELPGGTFHFQVRSTDRIPRPVFVAVRYNDPHRLLDRISSRASSLGYTTSRATSVSQILELVQNEFNQKGDNFVLGIAAHGGPNRVQIAAGETLRPRTALTSRFATEIRGKLRGLWFCSCAVAAGGGALAQEIADTANIPVAASTVNIHIDWDNVALIQPGTEWVFRPGKPPYLRR